MELTNGLIVVQYNGEKNSDRSMSDNRTKGFTIVDSSLLMKTIGHKIGFESLYGTIRMPLNFVHPFI